MADKATIRKIYECLPKLNCGLCGHTNCGRFARAVAEGKASPYGCRQDPWSGYKIARVLGVKVPTGAGVYAFAHPASRRTGPPLSAASIRQDVHSLCTRVDSVLARIDRLASRQRRTDEHAHGSTT